jgi:DNA-binding response OmpR family regulator
MKKLLLADDSPTIERMIRLNFEGEDIEIICARDGDRALHLFETEKPDIVLADIYMPGQNGFNVCDFVKHQNKVAPIPVILLVGSFEPFNEEEAERVKADGVLVKPLDSNQLLETVKKLLRINGNESMREKVMEDKPDEIIEFIDMDDWDIPEGVTISSVSAEEEKSKMAVRSDQKLQTASTKDKSSFLAEESNLLDIDPISFIQNKKESTESEDLLLELPTLEVTGTLLLASDNLIPVKQEEPMAEEALEKPSIPSDKEEIVAQFGSVEKISPQPIDVPTPVAYQLSEDDIDRIAQRVISHMSDRVLREIAWEIIPDLAAIILKEEAYKRPELLH